MFGACLSAVAITNYSGIATRMLHPGSVFFVPSRTIIIANDYAKEISICVVALLFNFAKEISTYVVALLFNSAR